MKRNNIDKSRKLRRNQTEAEKKLWTLLRNRQLAGVKFRRQSPVSGYILDFYAPQYKLNIEADGGQHYEDKGKQRDEIRTRELSKLGIETIRFSDRDILTNIEGVYEAIKKAIEKRCPTPSPPSSPPWGEEVRG
jgi:very-short-patch-repair endonuclease